MARKKRKTSRSKGKKLFLWLILLVFFALAAVGLYTWLTLPHVIGLKSRNPGTTSLMRLRTAQAKKAGKKFAVRQEWAVFNMIPDLFKKSVLVSEDASFYWHKGIDYEELKESIKRDLKEKKFSRGGSTITQQLAKNLYLSTEKSLRRKLREFLIARRLEKALTKDRIFGLYLNVIEFGPGVFGVQAASRFWFGKDVGDLTLEEMVRLTAIIPSPLRVNPRENGRWMRFKGRWIADTLLTVRAIGEDEHRALVKAFE